MITRITSKGSQDVVKLCKIISIRVMSNCTIQKRSRSLMFLKIGVMMINYQISHQNQDMIHKQTALSLSQPLHRATPIHVTCRLLFSIVSIFLLFTYYVLQNAVCIDTACDLSNHTCYLCNSFGILTIKACLVLNLPTKKSYSL